MAIGFMSTFLRTSLHAAPITRDRLSKENMATSMSGMHKIRTLVWFSRQREQLDLTDYVAAAKKVESVCTTNEMSRVLVVSKDARD
jgi:hypothetical protein